jgi:hypothetical protein
VSTTKPFRCSPLRSGFKFSYTYHGSLTSALTSAKDRFERDPRTRPGTVEISEQGRDGSWHCIAVVGESGVRVIPPDSREDYRQDLALVREAEKRLSRSREVAQALTELVAESNSTSSV